MTALSRQVQKDRDSAILFDGNPTADTAGDVAYLGGVSTWSLHVIWNEPAAVGGAAGTLTGTIRVEVSNDPRATPTHEAFARAKWKDVAPSITTGTLVVTTGEGFDISFVEAAPVTFVRVTFIFGSGAGALKIYLSKGAP